MSLIKHLLFLFSSLFLLSLSSASTTAKPHAYPIRVRKDSVRPQYVAQMYIGTIFTLRSLVIDLGARYLWLDCDKGYDSTTYRPVHCGTAQCNLTTSQGCTFCSLPPHPGCGNNTCSVGIQGPLVATSGDLAQDSLALLTGDSTSYSAHTSSFVFSCAPHFLIKGLARGATGMAGFGRGNLGLPLQLGTAFGLQHMFAMCLSSKSDGVIVLGGGPYEFLQIGDLSTSLVYIPLLVNPVSTAGSYIEGEKSVEYFIGVKSVKVNGTEVPLNASFLSIDKNGNGGTKISTVTAYTGCLVVRK